MAVNRPHQRVLKVTPLTLEHILSERRPRESAGATVRRLLCELRDSRATIAKVQQVLDWQRQQQQQ